LYGTIRVSGDRLADAAGGRGRGYGCPAAAHEAYPGAGAILVCPVIVRLLLTHMFVYPAGLPIALIAWAVLGWILYEHREQYLPMIR